MLVRTRAPKWKQRSDDHPHHPSHKHNIDRGGAGGQDHALDHHRFVLLISHSCSFACRLIFSSIRCLKRRTLHQPAPAHRFTMAKGFAHMSASEIDVALHLRQHGKSLGDIAGLLGRSKEAIRENTTPALVKKKSLKTKGRPQLITDNKFAVIMALVERMIKDADCRWEVTLPMVKRRSQFKGSLRTLSDASHKGFFKHANDFEYSLSHPN